MKNMTQNQTQATSNPASKKISNYLTLIVLIVIGLSAIALITAAIVYTDNPNDTNNVLTAGAFAVIGLVALFMSIFTLFQSRRQVSQMKIEVPKVMTISECTNKSCNTKTSREFQRGDYVYKDLDVPCGKCGGKQMITAIYKEVKEKEKTFNV
jgi:hypothetical protein